MAKAGAPAPGKEPAVQRDFGPGPGMRWAKIVRGGLRARGDLVENRIKEQQMGLFADRTSTRKLAGNQLRLYGNLGFAMVMMETLRRVGLEGRSWARAQSWTPGEIAEDRGYQRTKTPRSGCRFPRATPGGVVADGFWTEGKPIPAVSENQPVKTPWWITCLGLCPGDWALGTFDIIPAPGALGGDAPGPSRMSENFRNRIRVGRRASNSLDKK